MKKIFRSTIMKSIFAISIILIILACTGYLLIQFWTPTVYTKSDFTEDEKKTIINILGESFSDVEIEQFIFKHARETVNIFYVSNVNEELLKENYSYFGKYSTETLDGEDVSANLYYGDYESHLDCYVYQDAGDTKAVIHIETYYEELYQIAKD